MDNDFYENNDACYDMIWYDMIYILKSKLFDGIPCGLDSTGLLY